MTNSDVHRMDNTVVDLIADINGDAASSVNV